MAVVRSQGQIASLQPKVYNSWGSPGLSISLNGSWTDYSAIYRTQPNVRTVVSFLARNISQLGLKVYRRLADTDRQHLRDHPLSFTLGRPNPTTTRFRLMLSLVTDMGIYDNAFWIKLYDKDNNLTLQRVPPQHVAVAKGDWSRVESYRLFGRADAIFPADTIVHFRGHNPDDANWGLSPLETLRRILAEDQAAGEYREAFWRNSARMSGLLTTDKRLSPEGGERLRRDFERLYTGSNNSGRTAILEEGMDFKEMTFNAKDSEYIAARKLGRDEVAAAFHVPAPMVGILEHASFSNIEMQHQMLYQDTLGPWLTQIEQEIQLQLLPDFDDTEDVYVEFNLGEKLKGSFEDQVRAVQSATGAPWMSREEARAMFNMPPAGGGADQLIVPLNVLEGGQASPNDTAPPPKALTKARPRGYLLRRERHVEKARQELAKVFTAQRDSALSRMGAKAKSVDDVFNPARENAKLHKRLHALADQTTADFGQALATKHGGQFDPVVTQNYLNENARISAENINAKTQADLDAALASDTPLDSVRHVFEILIGSAAVQIAETKTTEMANFGRTEAAKQLKLRHKTWTTTSASPRPSHAAINGETVPVDAEFSIGGRWPGDHKLDADETANCSCVLEYGE